MDSLCFNAHLYLHDNRPSGSTVCKLIMLLFCLLFSSCYLGVNEVYVDQILHFALPDVRDIRFTIDVKTEFTDFFTIDFTCIFRPWTSSIDYCFLYILLMACGAGDALPEHLVYVIFGWPLI